MYFLTQVKRHKNGTIEKGVVVKNTLDAAKQSAHAYLGAYGYGADADIDYVMCVVMSESAMVEFFDVYFATEIEG